VLLIQCRRMALGPETTKKWLAVTVPCPGNISEAVADHLGVMTGSGVEIRPLDSSQIQKVTGFFLLGEIDSEEKIETAAVKILARVTDELEELFGIYTLTLPDLETSTFADQDWATSWQQFFTTVEIIPGLIIKPSWEEYTPQPGQKVITMDPGMAFGTGQHASTKLALSLIAACFKSAAESRPGRVLDIGTGTGILAMATALFGADEIMAVDNDPEAVTVATHNARVNQLDWNIGISTRPLDEVQGKFDLICANIIHDVLVEMAPAISRLAAHDSAVVLAGILTGEQETNIRHVYLKHGLEFVRAEHEEEWAALLLKNSL